MKEAIEQISTWLARAEKSKRGRTEVRASDLQDVLDLLLEVRDEIEPVPEPKEIYQGNQCRKGLCEKEVQNPIYYNAGGEWFKMKNLPYDATYKTIGRAYCSDHLEEFDPENGLIPKIITENIELVYNVGYEAMKELNLGDYIPMVVYHRKKANGEALVNKSLYDIPRIKVSHNGRQQKNGYHGHYQDQLNKITIFIKKIPNYFEIFHVFVHEMAHYFIREYSDEIHGDNFNNLLKLMADKLGYDFRGETPASANGMYVKV